MMKIIKDDDTFIVPLEDNKMVIVSSRFKNELIECLQSYFVSKKKTCMVYDDDGNTINMENINFIHIPKDFSFENNFEFKSKTILNNEFVDFIRNNPDSFVSVETIRDGVRELPSNKGFSVLKDIMKKGIDKDVHIEVNDFNIGSILQMLSIDSFNISYTEKYIILLNIILYVNRNDINIIYIDGIIDDQLLHWVNINDNNNYFIIDSEAVSVAPTGYDLLILSNNNHLIKDELTPTEIQNLIYMNHNIVKANLSLQNEKNVDLFKQFHDENSTFFLKSTSF